MCGRYRLSRRAEILAIYFYADYEGLDWEARYNIAPTQTVPVIRQDPQEPIRRASLMRWGLIPYWAKRSGHRLALISHLMPQLKCLLIFLQRTLQGSSRSFGPQSLRGLKGLPRLRSFVGLG